MTLVSLTPAAFDVPSTTPSTHKGPLEPLRKVVTGGRTKKREGFSAPLAGNLR
jgi:hypothetical protein